MKFLLFTRDLNTFIILKSLERFLTIDNIDNEILLVHRKEDYPTDWPYSIEFIVPSTVQILNAVRESTYILQPVSFEQFTAINPGTPLEDYLKHFFYRTESTPQERLFGKGRLDYHDTVDLVDSITQIAISINIREGQQHQLPRIYKQVLLLNELLQRYLKKPIGFVFFPFRFIHRHSEL